MSEDNQNPYVINVQPCIAFPCLSTVVTQNQRASVMIS